MTLCSVFLSTFRRCF